MTPNWNFLRNSSSDVDRRQLISLFVVALATSFALTAATRGGGGTSDFIVTSAGLIAGFTMVGGPWMVIPVMAGELVWVLGVADAPSRSDLPPLLTGLFSGLLIGFSALRLLPVAEPVRLIGPFLRLIAVSAVILAVVSSLVIYLSTIGLASTDRSGLALGGLRLFLGGLIGVATFVPTILAFNYERRAPPPLPEQLVIGGVALVVLSASAWFQYANPKALIDGYPVPLLVLPPTLALIALRWRVREVSVLVVLSLWVPLAGFRGLNDAQLTIETSAFLAQQFGHFEGIGVAFMIAILTVERRARADGHERQYRQLLDAAPEAMLLIDPAPQVLVDVNAQAGRMFGYSYAELLSIQPQALLCGQGPHDLNDEAYRRAIAETLDQGEFSGEWIVKNRFGQEIPCEAHMTRYAVLRSQFIRLVLTDVSVRRALESEREQSARDRHALQQFQTLQMNLLPVAYVVSDADGLVQHWNPSAEKVFGYKAADAIGHRLEELVVSRGERNRFAERFARMRESGLIVRGTARAVSAEGRSLVCEWHSVALRDKDAQLMGFLSVGLDVTERARADDAIRESEERYRRLVELSQDGIAILRDGLVVYANEAMTRMLKALTTTEVVGVVWLDFLVDAERFTVQRRLASLTTAGRTIPYAEQTLTCLNGDPLEVEMAASSVLVDGHIYLQVQTRDISTRKWTEREILRLNAELEQRVEERTAELRRANDQLESFSYSVAHDLRAPLRAMGGFSTILLEDYQSRLDAEAVGYLKRIVSSADRMAELIEDLLLFSQVSRTELTKARVNMQSLARQVVTELSLTYPHSQVEIKSLPDVDGDEGLLRQVLSNLIGNALKFSARQNQPRVEIGSVQTPQGLSYYVQDNGVGFDPQYANKLFGVFQRLHSTQDFEGTGVGLAIVHRIVTRHGGSVWASSGLDEGATFYFTIGSDASLSVSPTEVAAQLSFAV